MCVYIYIYICMQMHKKFLEEHTVNCGYSGEVHGNLMAY